MTPTTIESAFDELHEMEEQYWGCIRHDDMLRADIGDREMAKQRAVIVGACFERAAQMVDGLGDTQVGAKNLAMTLRAMGKSVPEEFLSKSPR